MLCCTLHPFEFSKFLHPNYKVSKMPNPHKHEILVSMVRKKKFYKNVFLMSFYGALLLLFLVRGVLPYALTSYANKRLNSEFPHFVFNIQNVDLRILRGEYLLRGVTGKMKSNGKEFLSIEFVTAEVPWQDILKSRIISDIVIEKMNLTISDELLTQMKSERIKHSHNKHKTSRKSDPHFIVHSLSIRDSNLILEQFLNLKSHERRAVTDLDLTIENFTPTRKAPLTTFVLNASIFGPAPLRMTGSVNRSFKPAQWDINTEMKNFDLTTINPLVKEELGAFIEEGYLDLYVESRSLQGEIFGYVKPFISGLRMESPQKGLNDRAKELFERLLISSEIDTIATKIPFELKKKFEFELIPALTEAIEQKTHPSLEPGIEDFIGPSQDLEMRQSEDKIAP